MSATHLTEAEQESCCACFFYGTLIHPGVLARIIGSSGSHLQVQQAILPHHSIHRVKYAEYPGLLASTDDLGVVHVARGVLVQGLTKQEIARLDAFEGEEYSRVQVRCITVGEGVANDQRARGQAEAEELLNLLLTPHEQFREMLQFQTDPSSRSHRDSATYQLHEAQTYMWIAPAERLQHASSAQNEEPPASDDSWRWEFEQFARLHSHRWLSGERN